jgi:hypothetical protein
MPAQRTVSPTAPRSTLTLIAALLLGIALGAGVALLVTARATDASRRRVAARSISPDKSRVALAREVSCAGGTCQELQVGPSEDAAETVAVLDDNRACAEIVWTPDGSRVAFLIDGSEMSIYDAQSRKLAGTVRLLTSEAAQSRFARGITFSDNGRAATFDDCPKGRSGCRAGVVGVPQ